MGTITRDDWTPSVSSSVRPILDAIAKQGSWYGGGSAAALACAMSAALLEKLLSSSRDVRRFRALRHRCAVLIETDARTFSKVIEAYYRRNPRAAKARLKAAILIPAEVCEASRELLGQARASAHLIKPRYRVDLRCAIELAKAAHASALALVETNLVWLDEPAFSTRIRAQLGRGRRSHARRAA